MDEFMSFLVGGLIIILALLLIFTFSVELDNRSVVVEPNDTDGKEISTLYMVGTEQTEVFQTYRLSNLNVSRYKQVEDITIDQKEIFSGVLFGSNSIKIHEKAPAELEKITISFELKDTNNYGDIIVKLNGETIEKNRLSVGKYNYELNSSYSEYNIEIFASSSGWKFWAPAIYELEDIKLETESFSLKEDSYTFNIDSETANSLTKGSLYIAFDDNAGELNTYINNIKILSRNITRPTVSTEFSRDVFNAGENTIRFEAGKRSFFSGTAEVKAFHIREREYAYEKKFNISTTNFLGQISFIVDEILAYGGLSVKIFGPDNRLYFSEYDSLEEKNYQYGINQENVRKGENTLRIEAVEDSAFHIGNVKVSEY